MKSRNRQILVAPMNGGNPCPETTHSTECFAHKCPSNPWLIFDKIESIKFNFSIRIVNYILFPCFLEIRFIPRHNPGNIRQFEK